MLELATSISLILAAVTVCAVKLIAQIEQNRFSFCKCLGSECTRDTSVQAAVVPTQDIEKRLSVTQNPELPKSYPIGGRFQKKKNVWISKKDEN